MAELLQPHLRPETAGDHCPAMLSHMQCGATGRPGPLPAYAVARNDTAFNHAVPGRSAGAGGQVHASTNSSVEVSVATSDRVWVSTCCP